MRIKGLSRKGWGGGGDVNLDSAGGGGRGLEKGVGGTIFFFPKRSLSFSLTIYCRFHKEYKVVIAETKLVLTLTLIQTKIISKR